MEQQVKDKLGKFFSQYKSQKYKKGEILIQAGEVPTGVFYLTSGVVKRYSISSGGEEVVLNLFKSGSFFPISWVLLDHVNSHYFEAVTDIEVWRAPKDEVLKLLGENNDITLDLLKRIYSGMEGVMMKLEYLMVGNANSRLITEILIYAKRFGKERGGKIQIDLKLTEKDLAAQSGMARETISREIQKLKTKGLLSFDKSNLIINNLGQLEKELTNA